MNQDPKNKQQELPSDVSSELIDELQRKYNVPTQEVLNAVIAANNNREKAEQYLRERTEEK